MIEFGEDHCEPGARRSILARLTDTGAGVQVPMLQVTSTHFMFSAVPEGHDDDMGLATAAIVLTSLDDGSNIIVRT